MSYPYNSSMKNNKEYNDKNMYFNNSDNPKPIEFNN